MILQVYRFTCDQPGCDATAEAPPTRVDYGLGAALPMRPSAPKGWTALEGFGGVYCPRHEVHVSVQDRDGVPERALHGPYRGRVRVLSDGALWSVDYEEPITLRNGEGLAEHILLEVDDNGRRCGGTVRAWVVRGEGYHQETYQGVKK